MLQMGTETSVNSPLVSTRICTLVHFSGIRLNVTVETGKTVDGSEIIIGFRLSSYAAGSTAVGPIHDLCHIPEKMKSAVKVIPSRLKKK